MSDFKVGDVVMSKCWPQGPEFLVECIGNQILVRSRRDGSAACIPPDQLCRASRPSDAMPTLRMGDLGPGGSVQPLHSASALKPGDRIVTNRGTLGVLVGDANVPGFRWLVDLGGPGQVPYQTNLREHEVMPAPALKGGDRVRVVMQKQTGVYEHTGRIEKPTTTVPYDWSVRLDKSGDLCAFRSSELELLPPEPAPANKPVADDFDRLANKKPYAGSIYDKVAKPMRMFGVDGFGMKAPAPVPSLPNNGWMPAGTYMPLGVIDLKPIYTPRPNLRPQEMRNGIFLGKCLKDGNSSSLATKNLKKPMFPERARLTTASWGPYADYDLLPDAD